MIHTPDHTPELTIHIQWNGVNASELFKSFSELVTKHDLKEMGQKIMEAITKYATEQKAYNTRIENAINGLAGDVESLNKKILELQNSAGQITPEDQALLNELQVMGEALATRLEAVDALTPPVIPVG